MLIILSLVILLRLTSKSIFCKTTFNGSQSSEILSLDNAETFKIAKLFSQFLISVCHQIENDTSFILVATILFTGVVHQKRVNIAGSFQVICHSALITLIQKVNHAEVSNHFISSHIPYVSTVK